MTYLTLVGLMGVWDCSSPYFSTPLHRMLVKQVELRQLCSKKNVELSRTPPFCWSSKTGAPERIVFNVVTEL
jgi:hypothetical protein